MQFARVVFAGTDLSARDALGQVMAQLHSAGPQGDHLMAVETALTEIVNNVVEHAYADRSGSIEIMIYRCGATLKITVQDWGRPFPGGELPCGLPVDVTGPRDDLPEGGFGWFLIRQLTCDLSYDRVGDRNVLTAWFEVPPDVV